MSKSNAETLIGTVKWFRDGRGFIVADDGYRDVFFHSTQILDPGHELARGERVKFVEDVGRDGRNFARRVELVKET